MRERSVGGGLVSAEKRPGMMRLFVAIELDNAVKDALTAVQRRLATFDRTVRWVGREQMHLTLKFLGEVADDQVARTCAALATSAQGCASFALHTTKAGCFPPQGKARVVWVGLAGDEGALPACQQSVEAALAKIGFPSEGRPFAPHLTVGRVKDDRTAGALRKAAEALEVAHVTQEVECIALIQSELLPQGARHTKLGEWRLGETVRTAERR